MCPRSGFSFRGEHANVPSFRFFCSGGTSERTLVPGFVPGEHPPKPPFWKPPFWATKINQKMHKVSTSNGVDCWISGNDGNHRNSEKD